MSKACRLPFGSSSFIATQPLKYFYADVWGPTPIIFIDGCHYFLLIVGLFSRYCWVYTLNAKSQVVSIFHEYRSLVEKQFNIPIKNLYTDNGEEFLALKPYLCDNGINWLTSAPHTPQQNDISEIRNRHILETARVLLHHTGLPSRF